MKLTDLPLEFVQATPVLEKIQAAGFEAYFVGGCVRDVLLNQPIHDVDIATSAFPQEIKQLFSRTIDVGIEHGTVLVLYQEQQYEITTFRTESTYQDFRRPDKVEFVRSLSEDLKRRDFTMNALALGSDGTIIDLYTGLKDIEQKMVRAVGNPHERFHEDALRMMRGLRFISQLDFAMTPATLAAITENSPLLANISVERITIEWLKLMMGKNRKNALELFISTNCYQYCPQLANHQAGLLKLSQLPMKQLTNEAASWALLIDQLELAAEQVVPFLKAWKTSNECIRQVQHILKGFTIRKQRAWQAYDIYQIGFEEALLAEELLCFVGQQPDLATVISQYEALPIHSLHELTINGHDLLHEMNRVPGKWLKETLSYLEYQVVESQCENQPAQLMTRAKEFMAKQES